MTSHPLSKLILTMAVVGIVGGTGSALAGPPGKLIEVGTDFENGEVIDPDLGLTIGDSPAQAHLSGGGVEIRGVRSAYNTPPHAWVFDDGEYGLIEFETPLHVLGFFSAVQVRRGSTEPVTGEGFATLLDHKGRIVNGRVVLISAEEGAEPTYLRGGDRIPLIDGHPQMIISAVPVGAVVIEHTATGDSFLSIDDLFYTVKTRKPNRSDD